MWLRKYNNILKIIESKDSFYTLFMCVFGVAFCLFVQIEYVSLIATIESFGLRFVMIGISGIIGWLFFKNMNLTNNWGHCLTWLGMNSLPIYLLHYFFLPGSVFLAEWTNSLDGVVLLVISVLLSLVTLGLTITLYKVLSYNSLFQRILFGKW